MKRLQAGAVLSAWILAAASLLLSMTGCGTTGAGAGGSGQVTAGPGPGAVGTPVPPPQIDYGGDRLHPGTRITIVFSGIRNSPEPHTEQIRDDGFIAPPLLDAVGVERVKAAGLTTGELQSELRRLYVPKLFRTVTITVTIDERYFFVGGEVRSPGQKPYLSDMTLLKAIQAAGDFNEYASKGSVLIIRSDGRREEVDAREAQRDPSKDPKIFPGDIITVPRYVWPI